MAIELNVQRFSNPLLEGDGSTALLYRVNDAYGGIKAAKIYKPEAEKRAIDIGERVRINGEELVRGSRDYEAAVMAQLSGVPYVVTLDGIINGYVPENGIWVPREGAHGLVREWAKGEPTSEIFKREEVYQNLEPFKVMLRQYYSAMREAAERGFSFADIKADDVIVDFPDGQMKIVDLNLAELLSQDKETRLAQCARDFYAPLERLLPTFYQSGTPRFHVEPRSLDFARDTLKYSSFLKEALIKGESYCFNQNFIDERINYFLTDTVSSRNHEIEIGRKVREEEIAKSKLVLSDPLGFLVSLRESTVYRSWFDSLVKAGRGIGDGTVDAMLMDSQWFIPLRKEMGVQFDMYPSELALLALKLFEETKEKN